MFYLNWSLMLDIEVSWYLYGHNFLLNNGYLNNSLNLFNSLLNN
jgi:hypothetical protein